LQKPKTLTEKGFFSTAKGQRLKTSSLFKIGPERNKTLKKQDPEESE
jgi:hypothetical protein